MSVMLKVKKRYWGKVGQQCDQWFWMLNLPHKNGRVAASGMLECPSNNILGQLMRNDASFRS